MKQKYPRTYHLEFSPGQTSDDKVQRDLSSLDGKQVIISTKMDGENTTLYNDHSHARSIDSRNHPSRNWLKQFHSGFAHHIPPGYRICGENVFAEHSLRYENLKSYFYGFSVWTPENICLSWKDTEEWFDLLGIIPVHAFETTFNIQDIRKYAAEFDTINNEGFVVRLADQFHYDDFNKCVVKWVRQGHVTTDEHWMHAEMKINKLEK